MESLHNRVENRVSSFFSRVFYKRVFSSLTMIAFMVLLFFLGNLAVQIFSVFLVLYVSFEWVFVCRLSQKILGALSIVFCTYMGMLCTQFSHGIMGLGVLFLVASITIIIGWVTLRRGFLWTAIGMFYIGIPFICLTWITLKVPQSIMILAWMVVFVSLNDVGGYIFGRGIGGPKLYPRVSPNKTWSGYIGGVLFSTVGSLCFFYISPFGGDFLIYLFMTIFLIHIAIFGDLIESAIKRYHGIKDSGSLIPGHGGALDRLDGYLTTLPFLTLIIYMQPSFFFALSRT